MEEQAYTVRGSSMGGQVFRSMKGLNNEGQYYREPSLLEDAFPMGEQAYRSMEGPRNEGTGV